ncbi:hypothetical protein A2U01_0040447, partial [Trifolium medium]|nr:hypothetical protein [Trifolium medium]
DKKKSSGGLKIGASEIRSKKKHEKNASKDDSETESDEVTLAQKLKQRVGSGTETTKAFQKQLSTIKETVYVSSSTSHDTAELNKATDELIQLGEAKFG